jgi:hypothetical protein
MLLSQNWVSLLVQRNQKVMKSYITILFSLLFCSCDKIDQPELYDFSKVFLEGSRVVRIDSYEVPSRAWRSEARLTSGKMSSKSLYGKGSEDLWKLLHIEYGNYGKLSGYRDTNQDYQLIAKNDRGEVSSVMICKTFIGAGYRFVACKNPTRSWICKIEESDVKSLGVK